MISRKNVGGLDMRHHWQESLVIAMLARGIGETCRLVDRDRLFVEGILSRLGQVVIHDRMGPVAGVVAKHASAKQLPLYQAQRNFLGCHYGEVGAALLRRWRIPDTICAAVAQHLEPRTDGEPVDVAILRLSLTLAPVVHDPSTDDGLTDNFSWISPTGTEIDRAQLRIIQGTVREDLGGVLRVILPGALTAA
jgi:HD-like signal output (HDOD) protein